MFCGVDTKPLRDIPQGTYTVNAAKKKCNTQYGDQYILSISEHGDSYNVWSNKTIFDKLEAAKDSNHVDVAENLLYLPKEDLGTLIVTGKGNAFNGHRQVYCKLLLNGKEKEEKKTISHTQCGYCNTCYSTRGFAPLQRLPKSNSS